MPRTTRLPAGNRSDHAGITAAFLVLAEIAVEQHADIAHQQADFGGHADFVRSGAIEVNGRQIVIRDAARLRGVHSRNN
jgi:hypothetical protein